VELLGVPAGGPGQPPDGVLIDACQARGLADAAAVGEVPQDRQERVVGQAAVEQRGALAFGEAVLAGATVEQAALLRRAVACADGEVAVPPPAVQGAVAVLAAEAAEVVHARVGAGAGCKSSWQNE
jgi:hypothetical protein